MFARWLDPIEEWLIAVCMAAATLIIFAAVLHRYSAGIPWLWHYTRHIELTWAQEACIYLFIWMAKFGAAYGVRTGIHVGVDVLVRTLPPAWQRALVVFSLLSGAAFTGAVAWLGGRFVYRIYLTAQVSPDLGLPMWVVYLAVPLGSSLMCWRFLEVLTGYLKTGTLPHPDHRAPEDAPA